VKTYAFLTRHYFDITSQVLDPTNFPLVIYWKEGGLELSIGLIVVVKSNYTYLIMTFLSVPRFEEASHIPVLEGNTCGMLT